MKKNAISFPAGLCLLLAVMVGTFPGALHASVAGSVHDFSTGGTSGFQSTNETEVCIFCHTPHNASPPDRLGNRPPIWNRSLNEGAAFTMYTSPTFEGSGTYDNSKPTGHSLLCMSCHDGVTTINSVLNTGQNGAILMPAAADQLGDVIFPPYRNPNLGTDLSNDHPVSFIYDNNLVTLDTAAHGGVQRLEDPATATWPGNPAGVLKLFNTRLECTTCHEPHEDGSLTGQEPFLRMSNSGSQMCTTCHRM